MKYNYFLIYIYGLVFINACIPKGGNIYNNFFFFQFL